MDIKLTRSKINLLEAKIAQFNDCGYFNDQEIARLTKPLKEELGVLHQQVQNYTPNPEDIIVNDPEFINRNREIK